MGRPSHYFVRHSHFDIRPSGSFVLTLDPFA
jgi:hypothetical protein